MKKRLFILTTLFFTTVCIFCLERINVGSYQVGNVTIGCYDDQSVRISDLKKIEIILNCIDVDAAVKASTKIKEVVEGKNIGSVEQMLKFFDREKIEYKYEKYGEGSDYYVDAQTFLEEYLVPKYGIKSGKKRILFSDLLIESKNWNADSKQYDYEMHTSFTNPKINNKTVERKRWNKNIQGYEYEIHKYSSGQIDEYKNWNKEKQYYDYHLIIRADNDKTEYKNWNKEKQNYDYCFTVLPNYTCIGKNYIDFLRYDYELATYSGHPFYPDHTEERKEWNKNIGGYKYEVHTYSDHIEEFTDWNTEKQWYDCCLVKAQDFTMEGKNFDKDSEHFNYLLFTYSDHTKECKGWNSDYEMYENALVVYSDRVMELKRVSERHVNIDIKDKNGKVIAYEHIMTPLKIGKCDIEVFSGGVVYQYFDVTGSRDGKTLTFKALKKNENGKITKLKGGTLSREEFYKDVHRLWQ